MPLHHRSAVPLGLLASGSAWGEWGASEVGSRKRVGYVPSGLHRYGHSGRRRLRLLLHALGASDSASFMQLALAYILSAVVGVGMIFVVAFASSPDQTVEPRHRPPLRCREDSVSTSVAQPETKPRRKDFVAKTINGVTEAIERSVYTEEFARRDGLLQRADPRAKVGVFVLRVLVVGLARSIAVILILYAAAAVLGLLSKLPSSLMFKRILIGIPLLRGDRRPSALFLIGGKPLVDFGQIGPVHLAITSNSVMSFVIFVTRVAASVTLAALLVVTTRWSDLLKAMRVFHVPEVFIVVLGMTYRYIFLLPQGAREPLPGTCQPDGWRDDRSGAPTLDRVQYGHAPRQEFQDQQRRLHGDGRARIYR